MKPDMLVMLEDVEYKVVSPVNAWLIEDAEGNQMEALESTFSVKEEEVDAKDAKDPKDISVEEMLAMSPEQFAAWQKSVGGK